jgi:hypothetical protein
MRKPDSQRPVTLEDILRLKRNERPPAEFWTQFDRELRAKQLAALVEKRPWWRTISLPRVFAGVRRFHLPLGAAAVLAVTVLSVREYHGPKSAAVARPVPGPSSGVAEVVPTAGVAVAGPATRAVEFVRAEAAVPSPGADEPGAPDNAGPALSSEATPSGNFAQMLPLVGVAASPEESAVASSPSARLIAENFAALQADEPFVARQWQSPARGFETRVLPARAKPVEPLSQMKIPSGSRRSNLIASATLAATTAPVLASDRSARGLSDERLYETISRVNARGAGMLVKF